MGDDTDIELAEVDEGDKQEEEADESHLDTGLVAEIDDKQQNALESGLPGDQAPEAGGGEEQVQAWVALGVDVIDRVAEKSKLLRSLLTT